MQVQPSSFLVPCSVILLVASKYPVESKALHLGNDPSMATNAQHPLPLPYQDAYYSSSSPYYIYNVRTDVKALPAAANGNGKPAVSRIPTYNLYYGTPIYDFRFPLNPVYSVVLGLASPGPGLPPKPKPKPKPNPSATTIRPIDDVDVHVEDGIEKLDAKVDPAKEEEPSEENDSVVVDSI